MSGSQKLIATERTAYLRQIIKDSGACLVGFSNLAHLPAEKTDKFPTIQNIVNYTILINATDTSGVQNLLWDEGMIVESV